MRKTLFKSVSFRCLVLVAQSLVFCVVFIYFADRCLPFFFWPLCCLSLFDLRLRITALVSSDFSLVVFSIMFSIIVCVLILKISLSKIKGKMFKLPITNIVDWHVYLHCMSCLLMSLTSPWHTYPWFCLARMDFWLHLAFIHAILLWKIYYYKTNQSQFMNV